MFSTIAHTNCVESILLSQSSKRVSKTLIYLWVDVISIFRIKKSVEFFSRYVSKLPKQQLVHLLAIRVLQLVHLLAIRVLQLVNLLAIRVYSIEKDM